MGLRETDIKRHNEPSVKPVFVVALLGMLHSLQGNILYIYRNVSVNISTLLQQRNEIIDDISASKVFTPPPPVTVTRGSPLIQLVGTFI